MKTEVTRKQSAPNFPKSEQFLPHDTHITQKCESQNGGNKKAKHAKFSKKTNIFYPLIHTRNGGNKKAKHAKFSKKQTFLTP